MTLENFFASLAGAITTSMGYHRRGFFTVVHVFLTSFFIALFTAHDVIHFFGGLIGFTMSSGAGHFLTAYMGAQMLDYVSSHIRGIALKWKF